MIKITKFVILIEMVTALMVIYLSVACSNWHVPRHANFFYLIL